MREDPLKVVISVAYIQTKGQIQPCDKPKNKCKYKSDKLLEVLQLYHLRT